LEQKILKSLLDNKIKELGFKKLGCYNSDLEKLTKEDLDNVLNNIEFASTDVQVSINNKKYIVEIMTCDNEIDFDVLEKQVYISRYGIFEEDYDEKFNNK